MKRKWILGVLYALFLPQAVMGKVNWKSVSVM